MSCNRVFTDFMYDVDRYLASKFEDIPSHYIQEISAYIASRVGVLAYDLCNERDKEWTKSLQRRKPNPTEKYDSQKQQNALQTATVSPASRTAGLVKYLTRKRGT